MPKKNYRPLVAKLQKALGDNGRITSITAFQAYSEKAKKRVTKYIVAEKIGEEYKNILATFVYPDVVKLLGHLYMKITDDTRRVKMTTDDGKERVFDNVDAAAAYAECRDTKMLLYILGIKEDKHRTWEYMDDNTDAR